jgi:hypothetical protein
VEEPEHWRWPGPVLREEQTATQSTADQRLLESRGATDWVHTDPRRVLRIQSEFLEGFGTLAELGPAVSFSDLLGRLAITRCTPLRSAARTSRSAAAVSSQRPCEA